jgi:hypothetical protein
VAVHIALAKNEWICLSENVPAGSLLHRVFDPPHSIEAGSGVVIVDCTREEAEGLLEVARRHCPNAVLPIQQAITRADASDV